MANGAKKLDALPSTAATYYHSSDEDQRTKNLSVPLSAFGRLENATGPSAVVFGTQTISKRYLRPSKSDDEEVLWEQALDFDLADLSLDQRVELAPVIAEHLKEAAQQYQSNPTEPPTRALSQVQAGSPPSRAPSLHFSPDHIESKVNPDDDVDAGTEDEESDFCCSISRNAPMEDPTWLTATSARLPTVPNAGKPKRRIEKTNAAMIGSMLLSRG